MLTKADFLNHAFASIDEYPALAALYRAGDPRITQHLGAMATMLAMFSAQVEVAVSEPFDKARDATILADAAMRGIVQQATPLRVRATVSNSGTSAFVVESGRTIIDSSGRPYVVQNSAAVAAGGVATFEALQVESSVITHTVSGTVPFYAIEIPSAEDGSFLSGLVISDADGELTYRERYVNTLPGERVFHVEVDDRQRVYVRLGYSGVVGVQPENGDVITIVVSRSFGDVAVESGTPFSFEYVSNPNESYVEMTMDSTLIAGSAPISTDVLRELAKYPSVYDENAVFLGEFDFLVRRKFPTLRFLSVWNESAEERARGASVDHINVLFVACLSSVGTEPVLHEIDAGNPVAPAQIDAAELTETQLAIKQAILAADDSYRVKFYTPVRSEIAMTINARVSTSYVASDVRQKIIDAILREFGEGAAASRRGRNRPLYRRIYDLLRSSIPALSGGEADLAVSVDELASVELRPEMWRYVSPASLIVTVETANIVIPSWGR